MDRLVCKSNPRIDLEIDLRDNSVIYRGTSFVLPSLHAKFLSCLVDRYPHPASLIVLKRVVGEGSFPNIRKRLVEKLKPYGLRLDYKKRESVRLVENSLGNVYGTSQLFSGRTPQDSVEDSRPIFTSASAANKRRGFAISIDGIILNSASELINGTVDVAQVRACRLLYRSSIEDLAFALVYGSSLSSKWRPRHEVAADLDLDHKDVPDEPAELLTSQLPAGVYGADHEDERFRYGRVLDDEKARKRVGEYITSLGTAIAMPRTKELCQEWLVREAKTYLGEHPSLFASSISAKDLHFDKKYYESAFLEEVSGLLGQKAMNELTSFLPKVPYSVQGKRKADPYSKTALREFVVLNVLTHITTMYEYEQIAEEERTHRLPFILRGAVKQQWHKDHNKEGQLKTLLVRSALNEGLLQARDAYGREDLIQRLLWVRDDGQFIAMRARLDELSALMKEPRSRGIARLVEEINSPKRQKPEPTNRVDISPTTIIAQPKIRHVNPYEYMQRLEAFFPELRVE